MGRSARRRVIAVAHDQPNERGIKQGHEHHEQPSIQAGVGFTDVLLFLVANEGRQLTNFGQLGKGNHPCNDDE